MQVPIWIGWWFWQNVFKDSLIRREQSRDQSNRQSSDPQSADPSSAGRVGPFDHTMYDEDIHQLTILCITSLPPIVCVGDSIVPCKCKLDMNFDTVATNRLLSTRFHVWSSYEHDKQSNLPQLCP